MLSLKLCTPILLERQLSELCGKLGCTFDEIRQLACIRTPMLGVIYEDTSDYKKYDLIEISSVSIDKDGCRTNTYRTDRDDLPFYTGFDAVLWLCKEKGIDVNPLTDISIPDHIFTNCDSEQWYDISDSFAKIEYYNHLVDKFMQLNAPESILIMKKRDLYEYIEFLECGKIGGGNRKWNHGRMVRGLNDIGYSLIDGMLPGMQGLCFEEYDEYVAKERRDRNRMIEEQWYISKFTKDGMDPIDALIRAMRLVNGNPSKRPRSIEGMGFWLKEPIDPGNVFSFLDAHKSTFIQSDEEQRIYDQMNEGSFRPEVYEVFRAPDDESSDVDDHRYSFWGEAVAAIMTRETGLRFEAFYADPNNGKGNRSCIIFPERPVWEYNEKEKKLSRNMLYQILDRYALELKLSVSTNCYYIMRIDDCDSVNPKGL